MRYGSGGYCERCKHQSAAKEYHHPKIYLIAYMYQTSIADKQATEERGAKMQV